MNLKSPSKEDILCLIRQAKTARNHYEIEDCLNLIDDMREALERMMKKTVWIPGLGYKEYEDGAGWQPIETAPCDDTLALVWFGNDDIRGPHLAICDLDHDSDPEWWAERGATHWMLLPEPPSE